MPGIFDYLATNPQLYISFLTMAVIGLAISLGLRGLIKLKRRNMGEAVSLIAIGLAAGIGFVLLTSTTRFSLGRIEINLFRTYPDEMGFLLGILGGLLLGEVLLLVVNNLMRVSRSRVKLTVVSIAVLLFWSFSASASIFLSSSGSERYLPPKYVESYSNAQLELSFKKNVRTTGDFLSWKKILENRVAQLLEFPTNSEILKRIHQPSYEVTERSRIQDIEVAKIRYLAIDDDHALAYLLKPSGLRENERKPGLVVISGHPTSDRAARALIEDSEDYQKAIAFELAKNGYLVIVPELKTYGERAVGTHEAYANYLQMLGKPLLLIWTTEVLQAANILRGLSEVERSRIGVIGISTGGLVAYLAAAFDDEIRAVVSASSLVSYLKVSAGFQDLHDQIPMLLKYADYSDVAALVAPRPMLISYGRNEGGIFQYEAETLTSFNYVREAYLLLRAEGNLVLNLHDYKHSYDTRAVIAFLDKHLAP